ncbi:MAG: hydroxylamine oxidase [Desulfarculaceae bacterium]|nr:hydroxylamine oxidase [Desulfarculaceae bacterium]MCF8071906.1 hydroxylamine oxidase [Desulfarculaceae bacterium]MCF8103706.1 hydroxylamine oxidase [Desulfarculaceae bacterium]MCF8114973.1 hydroxylamine oxidase [Desulfarculaceae bacterium]
MLCLLACLCLLVLLSAPAARAGAPISEATQACLDCHNEATPGIVADWKRGRMSSKTPAQALKEPEAARRVSAKSIPAKLMKVAVGCAECHTLNPKTHADTFEHGDAQVHVVVSPKDCATCHPTEEKQYGKNLMAHARGNLINNPIYMNLADQVNGVMSVKGRKVAMAKPHPASEAESCLYCHGTEVKVLGKVTREDPNFGEMSFPKLSGWPNRGVGRKNPDNSLGSCSACHTRHQFAIEMARSPYTCSECHKGPDVPVYKVYQVSKHGNIFYAMHKQWDMAKVPWTPGKDFSAPTCAACHASLLVDAAGNQIAARSHQMTDRIWVRLLGLIYSHPMPKEPETWKIKNAGGVTLATTLGGQPASKFLIGPAEQAKRKAAMAKVCGSCHSQGWVQGQFARLEQSNKDADAMVLAATRLMQEAWDQGLASGPAQGKSPFDEFIERVWTQQWLFYANSTRFASAMMGADMGVFDQGRWELGKTVLQMHDWIKIRQKK